ncbi:MAG: hypothetical protein KKE91_00285, partial [Candidatus Omnitrophica bacterium]|nr:hypothetical protein [Candidatus Omnitrophota bacterium]
DNFAIRYLPQCLNADSPWLEFSVEYNRKDNKIYFREKIELKKNKVSEEEYLNFKQFFQDLAKKIKQRIVLEEIK